jgi:sugar phosphate permease
MTSTKSPPNFAARLPFFYGWVIIGIAFISMAISVNARTSFSLLFPPILDEFGWSRGTIAATFSIGFIVSTILTPFNGVLMDRFGPRLILPVGGLVTSLGMYLSTFSSEPWHFYITLGAMVVGGTAVMSYIGHTLFLPNWFDRKRGLAIGIAFSGVGIGSIILFPWMQHAIDTEGWRYSAQVFAVLLLVVTVPLNIIFQRHRPSDLGLEPDGEKIGEEATKSARHDSHENRIVDREWVETDWTLAKAIRTSRFWWLAISFISALYAWYAVQVHQTRYLIDIGISAEVAAVALGLVGLFAVAGQIFVGALSDRIGRELTWSLALVGFFLTYSILYLMRIWPSEWLMYVMVGLQGFLGYGLASVFGAIPAELFSGRRYGAIFGLLGAMASLGAALGPWATGVFFDIWGNYNYAFIIAMAFCIVSIVTMWIAGPRKVILVAGRARKSS